MGRRKIEIQPITHERNRSVTFLKRKNGLFKKAYELGVLCSVDVAVIIFEERPGHHVKLYQYCSSDVHNIVQRHLRFDGEKDTRTPHDFSGNKAEDVGDDDDEGDDDDHSGRPKPNGKQASKTKADASNGNPHIRPAPGQSAGDMAVDMDYRSNNPRGSPMSAGSLGSPNMMSSGDRHSTSAPSLQRGMAMNNKRPRLAPMSDEHGTDGHMAQSAPASIPPGSSSNGPSYPYRLEVDLSYPPSGHLNSIGTPLSHGSTHPSLNGLYPSTNPVINSHSTPPFMPQAAFDFPRSQPPPTLRTVAFPSHAGSPPYGSVGQQQQQNVYSGAGHRPSTHSSQHMSSNNMFAELIGDSAGSGGGGGPQQNFPSFDWPVHSSTPSQPSRQESSASSSMPSNDNNWLDFLSGNNQGSSGNHQPTPLNIPHAGRPASNSVSSTRSGYGGGGGGGVSSTPSSDGLSPTMRRKRSRDDEGPGNLGDFKEEDLLSSGVNGKLGIGSEGYGSGDDRRS